MEIFFIKSHLRIHNHEKKRKRHYGKVNNIRNTVERKAHEEVFFE